MTVLRLAKAKPRCFRRHMTKGQRAMAVAKIYPELEKGGRGKTVRLPDGLSRQRISEARTILVYAADLADKVMSGGSSDSEHHGISKGKLSEARTVLRHAPDLADNARW